jgi:uncharacterized protein YggE
VTASLRSSRRALAALALLAASSLGLRAQNIEVNKDNRTVAVTATEHVTVTADIATVHIGYITFGRDRDTTYTNATKLSNLIIQALTTSGIPADSIESDNQSIEPTQNFQVERLPPAEAVNRKYQVQQSWLVRTSAANAAKLLDTAVLAGANQSGQIDWSLKDESASTASAAARAIQHAHRVAIQMVSGFGGKVGALLYASNESESSTVRPVPMMAMHKAVSENEPLAISPRRIERSVTVRAIFAIE